MKLEHFGMAEPGDCRLVFTAGAEELAAAVAQEQAEPDVPQEEDGLLKEEVTAEDIAEIAAFLVLRRTNAVIDEIEVHRANKAPFA